MKQENPYDQNKEPASHYWWEETKKGHERLRNKKTVTVDLSDMVTINFTSSSLKPSASTPDGVVISGYHLRKAVNEYISKNFLIVAEAKPS